MIWRLIEHDAASGPWNMAVDEALLAAASDPAAVPVLRVYGWKPECLSLGLSQARQDVNLEALRDAKIDLVRRPTGGSAIFHTRELTYSVSAPANHPLMIGGVLESYKRIAAGLSRFLSSLGLQSQTKSPAGSTRPEERDPVCFDRPASYEITVRGKKLIGSAQARRKLAVLQHGSLPLDPGYRRIVDYLNYSDPRQRETARERLADRSTALSELLPTVPSWPTLTQAIRDAFSVEFDVEWSLSELTPAEKQHALELAREKFGLPAWTDRF